MSVINKFLLLCMFTLSGNVYGQIWEQVASTEQGTVYFYDPASVRRDADIVTYWELVDYMQPLQSGNIVVTSSKTKVIQDCKNNLFKIEDLLDYDGHKGMGRVVNVELAGTGLMKLPGVHVPSFLPFNSPNRS